jgi:hypothetical protein
MKRQPKAAWIGARLIAQLTIVALVLWTVSPSPLHVPQVIQTLQEHAKMVAEHGHTHELEEDLLWAMHGHSHDVADHDHGQAALFEIPRTTGPNDTDTTWHGHAQTHWSPPVFRLDRPPRA